MQLLFNEWLRYMAAIVLIEDKSYQCRSEMIAENFIRQLTSHIITRGRLPSLPTVTGIPGADDDIMDNVVLIFLAFCRIC